MLPQNTKQRAPDWVPDWMLGSIARGGRSAALLAFGVDWLRNKTFARHAVALYGLHIFSAVSGLALMLLLAGLLGPVGYGIYAVAMVYANVFGYVACLGFGHLLVKTEAGKTAGGDPNASAAARRTAFAVTLLAGAGLAISGTYFHPWLAPSIPASGHLAFALAMVMVVPIAIQRLNEAILLGRHQAVHSLLPERLIRPSAMLLIVGCLWLVMRDTIDASVAVGVQLFVYGLSVAWVFQQVRKTDGRTTASPRGPALAHLDFRLLRQSLPFLSIGLTTLLATQLDTLMLARLSDITEVGFYRLAAQIAAVVLMVSIIGQTLLHPRIAKAAAEGRLASVGGRLPHLGLALGVTAIGVSLTAALAFEISLAWIGEPFQSSREPLFLLLLAYAFTAFLSPAQAVLMMGGGAKTIAAVNLLSLALNGILNWLLIPEWGGVGAAMATLISLVLLNLIQVGAAIRHVREARTRQPEADA